MQQLAKETAVMTVINDSPESQYTHVTRQMAAGFVVVNGKQEITAVNPAAAALLHQPEATLIGQPWTNWLPPETAVSAIPTRTNLHDQQVTITTTAMHNGTADGMLITLTPQQQVNNLSDALSLTQRLAGIGMLTASVAHELNNPVSIITTACGNLQFEFEHQQLSEDQLKRYLDMIDSSAWRCARILNVLRQYSHEDEPQTAVTDLNMIIDDALTLLQHQFRLQYHVDITTDLAENLPSIVCDHNRITQVVINLLANAREAMPNGGPIVIKTWLLPDHFHPESGLPTDGLAISVSDSGSGIATDVLPSIFNPFFTTKTNSPGLGLFIAKQIIDAHNGRISVENKQDDGALVTIVLPRLP